MSQPIIDIHCMWGPTPSAPNWNDTEVVCKALRTRGITQAFVYCLCRVAVT